MAVTLGVRTNRVGAALHDLVSAKIRQPIWWTQNDRLDPTQGVAGEVEIGDVIGYQITTAKVEKDPALVAFVYAHEVAHRLLDHIEEGSYIYGEYSRREAEADAFAYAYLYVTAEHGVPGLGRFSLHAITKAIRARNKASGSFSWSEDKKLADIKFIREIRLQEEQESGEDES